MRRHAARSGVWCTVRQRSYPFVVAVFNESPKRTCLEAAISGVFGDPPHVRNEFRIAQLAPGEYGAEYHSMAIRTESLSNLRHRYGGIAVFQHHRGADDGLIIVASERVNDDRQSLFHGF